MKILIPTTEKRQELRDKLIVVCQYNRKDNNEVVFGIDMMYKSQFPDFLEVEVLDSNAIWHEEDKSIQLIQSQEGFNWVAINMDQLATYRRENNIVTHQHDGKFYFYVNNILPEHRMLFENKQDENGNKLPGHFIDIIINDNNQ
jgi:hypothetical protein